MNLMIWSIKCSSISWWRKNHYNLQKCNVKKPGCDFDDKNVRCYDFCEKYANCNFWTFASINSQSLEYARYTSKNTVWTNTLGRSGWGLKMNCFLGGWLSWDAIPSPDWMQFSCAFFPGILHFWYHLHCLWFLYSNILSKCITSGWSQTLWLQLSPL